MADKGVLFIVSGFAGAGKGTVTKQVVKEDENIKLSISATTRDMRKGEAEGVDYFYITKEEFEQKIKNRELLEYAKYGDNYYGTPRKFVEDELAAGKTVILEIEVKGAANIKAQYPDAVLLFLTTKDVDTLRGRLRKRGTETDEVIEKRIKRAAEESELMDNYDYIVVNDDLEECIDTVHSIIISDYYKTENMAEFIKTIREDLADE